MENGWTVFSKRTLAGAAAVVLALAGLLAAQPPAEKKFEVDTIKTKTGDLKITCIGHGTLMFAYQDKIVHVDPVSREARYRGALVDLTRLEFDLLAELIAHPRIVYTRERLLEKVWGHQTPVGGKTVDVHVANLRRKLPDWTGIVAVRGIGYKLDLDDS